LRVLRQGEDEARKPAPALANSLFAVAMAPLVFAHRGSTSDTEIDVGIARAPAIGNGR
jgi:hypothetical protein